MKERNATDEELAFWGLEADQQDLLTEYAYFEDPTVVTMNVTDLFDVYSNGSYRTNFTLMRYATHVVNNTFTKNFSGKKGTALLVSGVSELIIYHNTFQENGPVTAVREMEYSPYYEYLMNRNRTITYFVPDSNDNGEVTCSNEMEYFNDCQGDLFAIDMPAT